MKRRNFLTALALAPLVPVAAKLAALEGPTVLVSTANQGFSRATNFAALSPTQMKVWGRDLFREAQASSFTASMLKDGVLG